MFHRRQIFSLSIAMSLALVASSSHAEVKLASIFSDSMVLQRELPAPVWGWADAGEEVTVTLGSQTKKTKAGDDGRWQVQLENLQANATGQKLVVAGSNTIELNDVLIGEVWICSGQSNMEWPLSKATNGSEEVAASDHPQIRLFNVPGHTTSPVAKETCAGEWKVCQPGSAGGFSAVGYFFGRRLQKELNVPIGLVGTNWGGTRIEPWVSPEGFHKVPELKSIADQVDAYTAETKVGASSPSAIYNAMVHPLVPFSMRGAIWYQGESNGAEGESYYHKTRALVSSWRELFNPNLGFYWVQLADFKQPTDDPAGGDGWAKLREAQTKALDIDHTGMAVITDIGEANDIHPKNKQDVGDRLAQWALHQTYDKQQIVPAGPLFKSQKIEGDSIRLSFDYVGGGLIVGKKEGLAATEEVKQGKLARFAIAGADKKWHWADATIDGDTVVVKSAEVAEPVAVRYAYSMNPEGANLYNKEGIPASPFRTDAW
ncbi:sialate O-acetylesterase [Rosistilla oblonga]|uniref:sialate O-acetylesterase n=1 Tax=Rosistilla oblonga TaxID=2527990 RepID=UPI003A969AAF